MYQLNKFLRYSDNLKLGRNDEGEGLLKELTMEKGGDVTVVLCVCLGIVYISIVVFSPLNTQDPSRGGFPLPLPQKPLDPLRQ